VIRDSNTAPSSAPVHIPFHDDEDHITMSRYENYHDLKIEVAAKVATVTLNRPEARNAINQRLIRELRTIWDDLADDPPSTRCC
jgi:1,4-dihydroxy-2-naphthoyl-CoA synthase